MKHLLFIYVLLFFWGLGSLMLFWPKKIQTHLIHVYRNYKMFGWWVERRMYVLELRVAGVVAILAGLFIVLVKFEML